MKSHPSGESFSLKGRFWIEGPQGAFLGHGRIRLLERIREHGSISAAAKSLKMSYRRAWMLVDAINRQCAKPLVITSTGGKGGGGAILTENGQRAIQQYWEVSRRFEEFLQSENAHWSF